MSDAKREDQDRELMERLHRSLYEAWSESDASTDELLVEAGLDPADIVRDGLEIIARLRRQQEMKELRGRFERMRNDVIQALRLVRVDPGKFRDVVASALAGADDQVAQIYHHKLQSVDPEDLASLSEDEAILTLFERLSAEEDRYGG